MLSWRCSLPAVRLSPHCALISSRTRSAPLTLFQLERCRNGVKCCSAQRVGQGTQPVPICALLDTLLPRTLSLGTTAGGCCASPAPWEHPRQTPTPAGQSHSSQTHAVALPRVCRVLLQPGRSGPPPGHPRGAADRSPARESGAALGETEAGGSGGGLGAAPGRPP